MIELLDVCFAYPRAKPLFDGLSLTIDRGAIVALRGPSGVGKSTVLRLVAGLERPQSGEVRIAGRVVSGPGVFVAPEKRRVGFVFQDHALFPHLDVASNVAFGPGARERASQLLSRLGLEEHARRFPHELSGGQRQRVALARALAIDPSVVLLDEPFASLDPELRRVVREETLRVVREAQATALLVTHDAADCDGVDACVDLRG